MTFYGIANFVFHFMDDFAIEKIELPRSIETRSCFNFKMTRTKKLKDRKI